jgi:hypothetical protein
MILPLRECWGKALSEPRERRALKLMVHLPVPDFTPGSLGLAARPHPRFRRPRRRPGAWAWLPLFGPRLWTPHQQRHLSGNVGQNLRVQAPAFRIPHSAFTHVWIHLSHKPSVKFVSQIPIKILLPDCLSRSTSPLPKSRSQTSYLPYARTRLDSCATISINTFLNTLDRPP